MKETFTGELRGPDANEIVPTPEDKKIFEEIKNGKIDIDSESVYELTTISDEIAEILSRQNIGNLVLNNVTSITDNSILYLSKFRGFLELGGLKSISDVSAAHLSKLHGDLNLSGLMSLSNTAAELLSQHDRWHLYLNNVTSLSDIAASYLAKYNGNHLVVSPAIQVKIDKFKK